MERTWKQYAAISLCLLSIGLTSWYIIATTVNDNTVHNLGSKTAFNEQLNSPKITSLPQISTTPTRRPSHNIITTAVPTAQSTTAPTQGNSNPTPIVTTNTNQPGPTKVNSTPTKITAATPKVTTQPPKPTATKAPPPTSTPTLPPVNTKYKDGTYSATGKYQTRTGEEQIGVTITVKNDIVTNLVITPMADNSRSLQDQKNLAQEIPKYVIGNTLDYATHPENIVGSSDTTDGFKNAVLQIVSQAQR
jgi:uncharacterized protein with FMN-binding domain